VGCKGIADREKWCKNLKTKYILYDYRKFNVTYGENILE
jgi:hypothetical protein